MFISFVLEEETLEINIWYFLKINKLKTVFFMTKTIDVELFFF